ncbi:MAG: hypothetical protein QOK49_3250 [Baekduia sp.]|nr:hypothetical protein [Baekduia sp.]
MTDRPAGSGTGSAGSPWIQPRFIAAAGVVGLIAVLGVGLAVIPGGDKHSEPAQAAPATAAPGVPTEGAPPTDPASSICGLPAGDQTVPSAAPKATKWELVGTMAVPTAPKQLGPGKVTAGLRSCFAHSPTGALYAASSFVAMVNLPATRVAAAKSLTAAGPDRETFIGETVATTAGATPGIQIGGFRVLNYSPTITTIDLGLKVITSTAVGYAHTVLTMRWEDRDWKAEAPPTGQQSPTQVLPSLAGYLPWTGV